jgi:hypothetical protein
VNHLKAINQKALKVEDYVRQTEVTAASSPEAMTAAPADSDQDVVALQQRGGGPPQQPEPPHIPLGCSLVFSPGWEADRTGGTAGLCQPVERDLFDCHIGCYWPAQVPDQLNHQADWTSTCAAAQKDWRKIDLVFP